jgi:hypothetical protein
MDLSFLEIPVVQVILGLAAMAGVGFVAARWIRRVELALSKWRVSPAIAIAAVCLVILAPFALDPRLATYRAFYEDIEVGMSREQLFEVMRSHYPDGGARKLPKLTDEVGRLSLFMDPEEDREPSCEGIFLKIEDDRVTARNTWRIKIAGCFRKLRPRERLPPR